MLLVLLSIVAIMVIVVDWKPTKTRIAVVTVAGMIFTHFLVVWISVAYQNSFDPMYEPRALPLYDPFREGTLTVSLDKPSTLTLIDNLPRLDGATALYPVYSAFVRAVYPADFEKSVLACNATEDAYRRLIGGYTDIIFVAGPSEEQLQMAMDAGVELNLTPIGREAFVFFVNSQNPVNGLSINDIKKIYSGEITNWRKLDGKNSAIRAFQRTPNSGSQTALIGIMGDTPIMTPPKEYVSTTMSLGIVDVGAARVSSSWYRNYYNAIGYSFLFFATEMVNNNKIKLLELNGVAPTRENIANRTYPYTNEFYAVTAGTKNPNVDRFIEWILSEQGQYLIDKTGYTPIYFNINNELFEAIGNNDLDKVQQLIEIGANVNAVDKGGQTAVNSAIQHQTIEILNFLIDKGANVNASDRSGKTSLMYASQYSTNPDILLALIENSADVNAIDKDGMTPLMCAVRFTSNSEILRLLIEKGAHIGIQNKEGITALDYVDKNEQLKGTEVYNLLQEKASRIAEQNRFGDEAYDKRDYSTAAEWYRKAAEQWHAQAQFRLGEMCENGNGVEKDDRQAVEWYRKAAEQWHVQV